MGIPRVFPTSVRFGWFDHGHHAIDTGAINRLPQQTQDERQWQGFLKENLQFIHDEDDMEDLVYDGPMHYVDLDKWLRPDVPVAHEKKMGVSWEEAQNAFSEEERHRLHQRWHASSIEPEDFYRPRNIFLSVMQKYDMVKRQLESIAQGNKRLLTVAPGHTSRELNIQRNFYLELVRNVGRLSHYIGDLFMPLHLTRYHDWLLHPDAKAEQHAFTEGMHFFLEGKTLTTQDYQSLLSTPVKAPPGPPLNREALRTYLIEKMQQTYGRMYDLVRLQQQALAQKREHASTDLYEKRLAEAVKPLLLEQLQSAQEALAVTLQSVWHEAGRPVDFRSTQPVSLQQKAWSALISLPRKLVGLLLRRTPPEGKN